MGALSLSHPQYSHLSKFGISPGISILNPDFKVAPIPGGLQTRSSSKVCRHGGAVPGDWATTQNNLGNALADLETRAPTGRRPGRNPPPPLPRSQSPHAQTVLRTPPNAPHSRAPPP